MEPQDAALLGGLLPTGAKLDFVGVDAKVRPFVSSSWDFAMFASGYRVGHYLRALLLH
ncbi:hypothetical protein GCM10010520_51200 [Rhizobium viscosum]